MSFAHELQSFHVREAMLNSTHDVTDNSHANLGDSEGSGTILECIHEEERRVVLRETDPIDLDDGFEIIRAELPQ